jgi:hypothetical protein
MKMGIGQPQGLPLLPHLPSAFSLLPFYQGLPLANNYGSIERGLCKQAHHLLFFTGNEIAETFLSLSSSKSSLNQIFTSSPSLHEQLD